jgi:single-stranded DNA-binding protein
MADITFTAFIEDTVRSQSGGVFVLKTSEPHRRKNDRDEWETTARTFRDVKVSRDAGINLDAFAKGDRVDIAGTEKTETRADTTGKKHYTLVVWASSIVTTGTTPAPAEEPVDAWATPVSYGDDTPF